MKIKKGDFVELDYIGRLKEDGRIFDLTSQETAKKEGLYHAQQTYGAQIICVGEGTIVKGIDEFLIGKEIAKHTLSLTPENAFGKKNAKLIKIMPMNIFKKQNLKPFPGLQINIDGFMGTVRSVSGGRVIVDFNHPLAGRDITYELTIKRIVTDTKEKIKAFVKSLFGKDVPFDYQQGKLKINFLLPEQVQQPLVEKMKGLIPEVKEVKFDEVKREEQKVDAKQKKDTTQS